MRDLSPANLIVCFCNGPLKYQSQSHLDRIEPFRYIIFASKRGSLNQGVFRFVLVVFLLTYQ